MQNYLDQCKGCMWGLAIGDALGFPIEFSPIDLIHSRYGSSGITTFVQAFPNAPLGIYSDDTDMSLAVARALLQSKNPKDIDNVMSEIVREFIDWANNCEEMRAPGTTCLNGCDNLAKGISWQESGIRNSKGCGAAMRSAPIGIFYENIEDVVKVSYATSICTHAHPTGIASGIATAICTYLGLHQVPCEQMIPQTIQLIAPYDTLKEVSSKLELALKILNEPPNIAIPKIGQGWIGEEAIAIALYAFLKTPQDYRQTVLNAANITGDSDSTACIAGAISGAYNGSKNIPQEWINVVENTNLILEIATALHSKRVI